MAAPAPHPALGSSPPSDERTIYQTLLETLLPEIASFYPTRVEVYGIAPERRDPFGVGFRTAAEFPHADLVQRLHRPYEIHLGSRDAHQRVAAALSTIPRASSEGPCLAGGTATPRHRGRAAKAAHILGDSFVLRLYFGPVEWLGPDDAVIEAGLNAGLLQDRHWLWRFARINGVWCIQRHELIWASRT